MSHSILKWPPSLTGGVLYTCWACAASHTWSLIEWHCPHTLLQLSFVQNLPFSRVTAKASLHRDMTLTKGMQWSSVEALICFELVVHTLSDACQASCVSKEKEKVFRVGNGRCICFPPLGCDPVEQQSSSRFHGSLLSFRACQIPISTCPYSRACQVPVSTCPDILSCRACLAHRKEF